MSHKFWDLPQKYKIAPIRSKKEFQNKEGYWAMSKSSRCLRFALYSYFSRRWQMKQINFFSFDGDQLLENAT